MLKTHKDLDVWKKAMDLVTEMYSVSKQFPKEELYGLTSQMRRAALSIPSNIAEGSARSHKKEFKQFLMISLGSAAELETQLILSNRLGYLNSDVCEEIIKQTKTVLRIVQGLIKTLLPVTKISNSNML